MCEDRWVMLSNQQLYIRLPAAPLPSFRMAESWRCHWTLKMIPLMLYSCMFSATADPLYCGPGRTVKGPQMGMNRCHFNYVCFFSLELGRVGQETVALLINLGALLLKHSDSGSPGTCKYRWTISASLHDSLGFNYKHQGSVLPFLHPRIRFISSLPGCLLR